MKSNSTFKVVLFLLLLIYSDGYKNIISVPGTPVKNLGNYSRAGTTT